MVTDILKWKLNDRVSCQYTANEKQKKSIKSYLIKAQQYKTITQTETCRKYSYNYLEI